MPWLHYLSWFFGGAFLTNVIPHFVSGVMGKAFQSAITEAPLSDFQIPLGGLSGQKEFLSDSADAPSLGVACRSSALSRSLSLACRTAQRDKLNSITVDPIGTADRFAGSGIRPARHSDRLAAAKAIGHAPVRRVGAAAVGGLRRLRKAGGGKMRAMFPMCFPIEVSGKHMTADICLTG